MRLLLERSASSVQKFDGEFNVSVDSSSPAAQSSRAASDRSSILTDAILIAAGRQPNVESLDLEKANIAFNARLGVEVDDHLRTTSKRIYAAGDVCSRFKFTHAADAMARIVIQNALFLGRKKATALTIPWCTYTSPEVAHVGLTEEQAQREGTSIDTFTQPLTSVDRNVLDGDTDGFVKVHVKRGSDTILGGTIVDEHAGDLIGYLSHAMTQQPGTEDLFIDHLPLPDACGSLPQARRRLQPHAAHADCEESAVGVAQVDVTRHATRSHGQPSGACWRVQ